MATNFPTSVDNFPTHTDNTNEKVAATHINNVQDGLKATQQEVLTLKSNPVMNFKRYKQATAPAIGTGNALAGDEWYDTTNNRWKYCNGTSWIDPLKYV